jgi:hypothetical protein
MMPVVHPLRAEVDATLAADPRVVGWGLVGSYGRGGADRWSDLDVLVAVDDGAWDDAVVPDVWPPADAVHDGRRNVRVGAHAVMTAHVRDGLPLVVDWYLHPASAAAWPSDCLVVVGGGVGRVDEPFADGNARGERRTPLPPTETGRTVFRLRMVEVAAKRVARGDDAGAREVLAHLGADVGPGDDLLSAAEALVPEDIPLARAVRNLLAVVREERF